MVILTRLEYMDRGLSNFLSNKTFLLYLSKGNCSYLVQVSNASVKEEKLYPKCFFILFRKEILIFWEGC